MGELDHKEDWGPKNWCFGTVVLAKPLENPLGSMKNKPVNPMENQPWIFIGRAVAEADTPILWPPDAKSWLTGKDLDAGKGWKQKVKRMAENKMIRWHHLLNGHENLIKLLKIVEDRGAWQTTIHDVTKSWTQTKEWKTATTNI